MHPLLYLLLITGSCLAHYRTSYDTRNFIVREEPFPDSDGELVECPVCMESESWVMNDERCPIKRNGKNYKRCKLGTYVNEVCGGRRDCFRGAGEPCTEKMEFDIYGKKCGYGFRCHKSLGVCIGLDYIVDSSAQWHLSHFPYTWRRSDKEQIDDGKFSFEGTHN